MERAKLIVKNFGPLKDIEIEVREMVTFIGAQASGKSTLAKLISIFEDENFRGNSKISFYDELKKYNILSYLNDKSYIKYQSKDLNLTIADFTYDKKDFVKNTLQETLSMVKEAVKEEKDIGPTFIEVTKKLAILLINTFRLITKDNFYLIFETDKQKVKFESEFSKIRLNNLKVEVSDIERLISIIEKEDKIESYINLCDRILNVFPDIFLFDSIYIPAERNFLHLITENVLGLINNDIKIPKHLLNIGQEYEKAIQTIKELPLSIIDQKIIYKREGKSSYIYHNKLEKVDLLESASGLQSLIPILLLVEYSKSLKKHNFNFVVEEPELNLYPKAQHELIKYLVKNCLFDRKNLIITTHSPFVLASINNLLLAYDKGQTNPKEVNKIIKKESWLNPKNFIAYELKNGKAKKIMNDKLGQISENMIDGVSDSFADEFNKLLNL